MRAESPSIYLAALLVVASALALVFGLSGGGVGLIWVSVALSAGAVSLLVFGVLRRTQRETAIDAGTFDLPEAADAGPAAVRVGTAEAPGPASARPAGKRGAAPRKKPAAKPSPGAGVVAIPDRGTYHTAGCRYVKDRTDVERITKATAKRRGYSACGTCRPG